MCCNRILLLWLLISIHCYSLSAQSRPNILWITIEDTSPQFIGCYGNKDAKTPVIDQLAKEGIRFVNAFSTGTVCSPSRSTIITGVRTYAMGTGHHRSNYPIPGFIKGFPYYLQQAGYYTSNNSKTDYNVGNMSAFTREAWNESSATAAWWKRKPGQPFFAVFNFMDSHQSRTMTNPYSWYREHVLDKLPEQERIGDNDFVMPPIYHDNPEMRKQFARVYNSLRLTDNEIGALLKKLEEDHLRDSTIIFFYADHGEGEPRGKTNGINLGYRVPFVIWFPDMYRHLSPWGRAGVVTDELIDFEDLAPTLISLAGGTIPDYMKGRILLGNHRSAPANHLELSADRSDNGIDMVRSITDGRFIYSRNYMPFMPELRYIRYMEIAEIKQQMRKDFAAGKLNPLQQSFFQERPAEFLFDISRDTWETRNLVSDPAFRNVLARMRKQLDESVIRSRDVLFLPEYELGMLSKNSTPYEYRLSDSLYDIHSIYKAASLSGKRGKDIAARQVQLLSSNNKIVRYWAVTGLRSQPPDILRTYQKRLLLAMKDTYPPVAMMAAAIVYHVFNDRQAQRDLIRYSEDKNNNLSLMTINLLLYESRRQPFAETIRAVHDMPGRNYDVKAACMDFLGSLDLVPNTYEYRE